MSICAECREGKFLPRVHKALSLTLVTGKEKIRKAIGPSLTSLLSTMNEM